MPCPFGQVKNEVPTPQPYSARIAALVAEHREFVESEEQQAVVAKVQEQLGAADAVAADTAQ